MSTVCGFKLIAREMYVITLEGTRERPSIVSKETIRFPSCDTDGEFLDWAESQFAEILNRQKPDKIVYWLTPGLMKGVQILRIYFGLAMLNHVAHKEEIPINPVYPISVCARAFGLKKSASVDSHIQNIFPSQTPPWNTDVRKTLAIALLGLD